MLLATIAMAFNLFGNSWVNISAIVQSGSTETSLRVRQSLCILDQSGFEEFDFSESEEDVETETEELSDDLFTGNHALEEKQILLAFLMAMSLIKNGLASIRIYARIFL
jgi:hypothetical protein